MDHGIYAVDFNGVVIKDNTISGWPPNQAGGSIKARNGQDLVIKNNTLTTSGILLYTYKIPKGNDTQRHLNNVTVKNNKIIMEEELDLTNPDLYHGIGYWSNFDYKKGLKSIRIESNTITNGYVYIVTERVNPARFNADGGGVFDNTAEAYWLRKGIARSGNTGSVFIVD